jgi:hypothetical protein
MENFPQQQKLNREKTKERNRKEKVQKKIEILDRELEK